MTLSPGDRAPELNLAQVAGAPDQHDGGLTLAIFFKTGCPGCQYAFPFYERLYQAFKGTGLHVLGISQHDTARTIEFVKEYGVTFPILNDEKLAASRRYDPDFVPTAFLIDKGKISKSVASWNREQFGGLTREIANRLEVKPPILFSPGEDVGLYKAG